MSLPDVERITTDTFPVTLYGWSCAHCADGERPKYAAREDADRAHVRHLTTWHGTPGPGWH